MNKRFNAALVATAALLVAACEGDDGRDGVDGTDGLNALVATRDIPKGDAVCLGGGLALDSGQDLNGNGVLDADEVTATELLECEGTPMLRALHASPDAPAVNILVNDTEVLSDVDYAQGSGFLPAVEEVNVQVEAIIPGGNAIVIDETLALDYNTDYTVIAVDDVAGLRPLVIANRYDERLAPGNFFAQVVHASPSAQAVDVYVTTLGADLDASAPINTAPLAFEEFTPRLEVPEGDYQIRVTAAGDTSTVFYDSGEVSLASGADLLIAAVENVGPGDAAVQLVVLDGAAAAPLYDASTPAAALAVHLSPDAPAVDILADIDSTANDEALPLAVNVDYTGVCVIENIPAPEDYTLSVVANADNSIVALQFPFAAAVAGESAAIVSGFLSSGTPAIQAIALDVDARSIATEAKLRLTHGSPSTPNVDIYLLPDGGDLDAATPDFADVPFGADTGILSIAPGTYDVYVTATGSKTPAISVPDVTFTGGEVWDVIARDPIAGSMEMGPQALVVDYDAVTACTTP